MPTSIYGTLRSVAASILGTELATQTKVAEVVAVAAAAAVADDGLAGSDDKLSRTESQAGGQVRHAVLKLRQGAPKCGKACARDTALETCVVWSLPARMCIEKH